MRIATVLPSLGGIDFEEIKGGLRKLGDPGAPSYPAG